MNSTIQKYAAGYIGTLKMALAYRVELFLWGIIDAAPILGMLVLWYSVIPANSNLQGYTQTLILQYYLIGFIFRQLAGAHFEDHIIEYIKKGTFSFYLLKPISIKFFFSFNETAWRFMGIFTSILPIILAIKIFIPRLLPSITFSTLVVALLFIMIAYVLECIYSLFICAMGFIFENAKSFMHFRWITGTLFSGILIPFELMPKGLQSLSNFLPFKYRFYLPVNFVLGKIDLLTALTQLFYALIWILGLSLILHIVWKLAIKSYTSAGQ